MPDPEDLPGRYRRIQRDRRTMQAARLSRCIHGTDLGRFCAPFRSWIAGARPRPVARARTAITFPNTSEGVLRAASGSGMSYHTRGADRIDNIVHADESMPLRIFLPVQ